MPFGPYESFEDCVSKNGDKSSAEGFCSFLEHQITGEWPGAGKHNLPQAYIDAYAAAMTAGKPEKEAAQLAETAAFAAGFDMARFGWIKIFQAPKMKSIKGVKVFAAGTWTDSSGATREWTEADLDRMVAARQAGVPKVAPVKCGHTSDAFNKAIAEALGVPQEVVTGDKGQGQISLGRIATLERVGSLIEATFEGIPEPIANLIEAGLYSTVSVEVEEKIGDYGPVITGVALLGAEEPAVDKATLAGAAVFGGAREGASVMSFQAANHTLEGIGVDVLKSEFKEITGVMDTAIAKTKGATIFKKLFGQIGRLFDEAVGGRVKAQEKNEQKGETEIMDIKKLCAALGLPDTATEADIMTAIEALKGKAAPPEGMPEAEYSKSKPQFAAVLKENKDLKEKVEKFQADQKAADHTARVAGYLAKAKEFKAVPGTPDEIAAELTAIEEAAGKPAADKALAAYTKAEELAIAAGVTRPRGSSKDGKAAKDFDEAVSKYQKENPTVAHVDAIKAVSAANPGLYLARNK